MYLSFFGLERRPFQLAPDPGSFFLSREHKKALTHLTYGITFNQGFMLVTGEVGIGKTTIIRKVMKELDSDVRIAKITNTRVSSNQLWALINDDFGLDAAGKDKTMMLKELTNFLISEYSQGHRCMLVIDEAQNLTPGLLEEIRLLSNLETDNSKLLQIILLGQPELRETLARPELRQLRQRINISCHLNALTKEETESYIFHRLESAGNRDAAVFETGAIDAIYDFSKGIPRLVNIICDFLFLAAYDEGARTISTNLTNEVIGEIEQEHKYWNSAQPKADMPLDGMKEMLLRLKGLEKAVLEKVPDGNGRQHGSSVEAAMGDMMKRVMKILKCDMEAAMGDMAERFMEAQSRLQLHEKGVEDRFAALENELRQLRLSLLVNEKKVNIRQKTQAEAITRLKTKNLWGRIFSK